MLAFSKARSSIGESSFDGYLENTGENCDECEEDVQLLRESDALAALDQLQREIEKIFGVKVTVEKIEGNPVSYLLKRAQKTSP